MRWPSLFFANLPESRHKAAVVGDVLRQSLDAVDGSTAGHLARILVDEARGPRLERLDD